MIIKTISIDADRLEVVQGRIAKMNKKAEKLGLSGIDVSMIERNVQIKQVVNGRTVVMVKSVIDMNLSAEVLKYGNYEHIATLDHTVGDMPMVKTVPNKMMPIKYQSAGSGCDHCGISRKRNNTFIFKDDDDYKQVGSTCLKEFFGIDPIADLNWFADLYDFDDDDYVGGGSGAEFTNTTVLSFALAVVNVYGYVSGKSAKESGDMLSTADRVRLMIGARGVADVWENAEKLEVFAEELIKWGLSHYTDDSDYAHNMRIILDRGHTGSKYYGYLVSVISAYNNANVKALKAGVVSTNEFIGAVGDKILVDVIVDKVIPVDGTYGTTYINLMTEANTGNSLVWFSSNYVLDGGDTVKLKGTIKALNERDGTNQTILTRCKVI